MTVDEPAYHFNIHGRALILAGREAVAPVIRPRGSLR
jgi:hypothetical protein